MPRDDHPDDYSMSFGDHLEELRRRLLWALAAPVPLMIVLFIFSDPIIAWLYRPLDGVLESVALPRTLQALGPAEVLGMKLKLSLIFALVLAAPWILWQAWLFVRPGLYRHEQRFAYFLLPGSAVLTVAGVALLYFVMLPFMLRVLVHFGESLELGRAAGRDPRVQQILEQEPRPELRLRDPARPSPGDVWVRWGEPEVAMAVEADGGGVEIVRVPPGRAGTISQEFRLTTYVNFVLILMLGIVLAFQMPLVILLLGWLGLVTPDDLRAKRKHAVLVCALVAAVTTPADALSMVIMLVPLVGLFELSILLLRLAPASAVAEGRVLRFGRRGGGE